MKRFRGQTMTRSSAALLFLLISGCAQVEILRRPSNDAHGLRHAYTARTFFYSNNMEVPRKRMLGAAARFCQLPVKGAENRMDWLGPYGIHGAWMLDFSCPAPAN